MSDTHIKSLKGFSLLEMIGVMAVMAILAAAAIPVTLGSLESAAVRAEKETLRGLATAVSDYARDNAALPPILPIPAFPTPPPWATALTSPTVYTSDGAANLRRNKRNVDRVFLTEPTANPTRALLISGMRAGLNLPSVGNLNNLTAFNTVWDTAENAVPGNATGVWSAWNGRGNYLCIERINLQAELRNVTVTLHNGSAATIVSYRVYSPANLPVTGLITINPGATLPLTTLKPGQRVNLYNDATGTVLGYAYIVAATGRSFDFTTAWTPL